ncbi:HAD-like domain [Phytophthora cinnamomi]|uniref:HAD-like domain n=1 Tax=Phytophthora cinnamomi TaxID=4785 RepID=UPI00355A8382|nr:HAD-like domain [Phytophthora cinnamomi]
MSRFATARTPSVLLCTDFDETITQRDTTSLLFQLACSPASTAQQLVTQYVTELDELLKSYEGRWATQQQERERNFDAEGLREFLRGYAATDLRSTQRVVACLALRGIRRPDIFAAAGAVQLRANCAKTLAAVEQWEVLSTNWSTELVAAALQHAGVATASTQIVSNELKMDEHGVSTGEIDVTVQSPVDKERRVAELRSRQGDEQSVVVFVGDSATDLLAMLEADVGVWLDSDATSSSSKLLQRLVACYGIDIRPLTSCNSLLDCMSATKDSRGKPVIFTATAWSQLQAVVGERLRN